MYGRIEAVCKAYGVPTTQNNGDDCLIKMKHAGLEIAFLCCSLRVSLTKTRTLQVLRMALKKRWDTRKKVTATRR